MTTREPTYSERGNDAELFVSVCLQEKEEGIGL